MESGIVGHLAVAVAFAFNVIAGIGFFLTARGNRNYENLARLSYNIFTGAVTLAVIYLFYLFFSHNFAFKYVYEYSDRGLDFAYLVSAFWGGQEGTYLLWLFLNALFGYIILNRGGQYRDYGMAVYAVVNIFFLVLLVKLSPFAPLEFFAEDGVGLNPLLQDPWMVIHPPVIFLGYSMAAVPFALALAALIKNDFSDWLRRSFPWMAITSLFLAAGNILGGYWAYKTLGWGGFWAWDPVENSSLVPWFASLAALHGMIIEKRTGAFQKTNILMTAFLFIMVIYGTFLTRSGVLSDFSVHSFVDLGINGYLVGFLIFYTVLTFALFLPRVKSMKHVPLNYNIFGREFMLFSGATLLFIFAVIVLFWSSLPIITGIFSAEPRAADLSTYNSFALPLAVVFSLLLAVGPFITFQPLHLERWPSKLIMAFVGSAVVGFGLFQLLLGADFVFAILFTVFMTGLIMFLLKKDMLKQLVPALIAFAVVVVISIMLGVKEHIYLLYLGAAAMAIVSNLISVWRHLPGRWRTMGGGFTHFGFGIMLIGVLGSTAYSVNNKMVLPRGDTGSAFDLNISYQGMEHDVYYPRNELILLISHGEDDIIEGRPELYYSKRNDGLMRRPYIYRSLFWDIYMSPQQLTEIGSASGMRLITNQPQELGGYQFTFLGYEMGDHAAMTSMEIIAPIEITDGDTTYVVRPAQMSGGKSSLKDRPDKFGPNGEYSIVIDELSTDGHGVVVKVPELLASGPPDQLVLDVARKPAISLVWLGTTILMLGVLISFWHRRQELYNN